MRRAALAAALGSLLLAAAPGAAAALPQVTAHRGGSFVAGKARYPENTLPAFRAAAQAGFALEVDARVTWDGVVALHDRTLDRTTRCTGRAAAMTLAAVVGCPTDRLGSRHTGLTWRRAGGAAPPGLGDVLALARDARARVVVEIKDATAEAANRVIDVVVASRIPLGNVVLQSFFPPALVTARQRLPDVPRTRLSRRSFNAGAISVAKAGGSTTVSPRWPVTRTYVRRAHHAGLRVVPYTLNRRHEIRTAARIGVDAIVTDDPVRTRRILRALR